MTIDSDQALQALRAEVLSLSSGDGGKRGEVFWVQTRWGLITVTEWADRVLTAIDGNGSVHLSRSIDTLQLSTRPQRCLKEMRVKTIGELCSLTFLDLLGKHLGPKSFGTQALSEVELALGRLGLKLSKPVPRTPLTREDEAAKCKSLSGDIWEADRAFLDALRAEGEICP